jgi:hypothetical protein
MLVSRDIAEAEPEPFSAWIWTRSLCPMSLEVTR